MSIESVRESEGGKVTKPKKVKPESYTKIHLYSPNGKGRSGKGWVPSDLTLDVLSCMDTLRAHKIDGPFELLLSVAWEPYMDKKYLLPNGTVSKKTVKERLLEISGISSIILNLALKDFSIKFKAPDGELTATFDYYPEVG